MTLAEFYEEIYSDKEKLAAYRRDPEGYIEGSDLSSSLKAIALSNNASAIAAQLETELDVGAGVWIILLWFRPTA